MTGTPGVMGMGIVLEGLLQHRRGRAGGQQAGQGGVGSSQGQGSGTGGRGISWSKPERGRAPRRHSQMPISPGMGGMYLLRRRACTVAALYLLSGCTATQLDENSLALRSGCGVRSSSPAEVMPPWLKLRSHPAEGSLEREGEV